MSCDEREFSMMENGCLKDFYFDDSSPLLRLSPLPSHEEWVIPDKPHVLPMPKQAKLVWGLSDDDVKRLRAKNIVPDKKTRTNHFMLRIASPWLWRFFKSELYFGKEYANFLSQLSFKDFNMLFWAEREMLGELNTNLCSFVGAKMLNVLVNSEDAEETDKSFLKRKSFPVRSMSKSLLNNEWENEFNATKWREIIQGHFDNKEKPFNK